MKLRGRFTLWFTVAALVPIAAATLVTREVLSRSYLADFEAERSRVEERARQLVSDLKSTVDERVRGLASPDNDLIGGLLIEMEKSGGTLPPIERRLLVQRGRMLMTSLGLDVLFVLDGTDTVLIAPHHSGLRDSVMPEVRERAESSSQSAFFLIEPAIAGDRIQSALVVEAGRTVRQRGQSISVVGGQKIDDAKIASLRHGNRVDARVVDGAGDVLIPARGSWDSASRTPRIRVPLNGNRAVPAAWIEISVSDAGLAELLGEVTVASFVLGGAALFLTLLLGFVLSRRITGDLDALVVGAHAVSRDDFEHRVDVDSRDEVGAVAEAFNAMLDDLQESKARLAIAERIAAWQEIARSLAHEIKNPLTPIQMSVETMRRSHAKRHESFEEIFEESTATILEETARLKRIVAEFSEFARMPKASKQQIDVNEVVQSAVALYKGSVQLECELEDALPMLEADRDQLTQVLLNLLENARDAIAAAGDREARIRIETRLAGRAVEISVADNGPGIPESLHAKIFTPYFTTKGQRGTGLGLATVHRIVSDHGGRIRMGAGSSLGGAEFVIALPCGPSPLALTARSVKR